MNEETVLETEIQTDPPTEPTSTPDETTAAETGDWTVALATEPEETLPETIEMTTIEVIESVGSDVAHACLFSGFLVCGTLIGLALLRKIYGS